MASADEKFMGWVAHDKSAVDGKMVWEEFTPKTWNEDDVQIDVIACGICASDLHTLRSGWGESDYPTVVGHEIAGRVTRVGSNIKHLTVGQRVAIGAQCDSCRECKQCKEGRESYCDKMVGTYQGTHKNGAGKAMGGYANKWRGPGHFAIPIPDGVESHVAGPCACGCITGSSPLMDYGVGKEGMKRVGVVGVGGIGHFVIAYAKAMGAEQIVAISTTHSKEKLAKELGATDFVAMKENPTDHKKFRRSLDLIVNTASNPDQPFDKYLWMLRPRGHLINIAVPESAVMPIPIGALIFSGASIGGSAIGGVPQLSEMYKFIAEKKPNFMIEKRDMKDANQAIIDMNDGKPRFRYALVNEGVE